MPQLKKKTVKLHKAKTSNEGQGTYVKKVLQSKRDTDTNGLPGI